MRLPSIVVFLASFALGACVCRSPPPPTPVVFDLPDLPDPTYECDWSKPEILPESCRQIVLGHPLAAGALISTPFLPWPPPKPAHYVPLQGKVSTQGRLGDVAGRLALRLRARGYENFLYYEVPGGFAVTTELERFDDAGRATGGSKRFQRGQLGGWYGFVDLFKKVLIGEEGRFRVFVFVVSSEAFPIADYPAKEVDVERWGQAGSLYLSKAIAAQPTSEATAVTLMVYEFTEDAGRAATLVATRPTVTAKAHLGALGL